MTSTQPPPTLEEWRRLYDAAEALKKLAPWQWLEEVEVFGVINPETRDLGFVSVMGQLGEHLAITVYQGAEALYRFWQMQQEGLVMRPEKLLETPQLQASFEDRGQLEKEDLAIIKRLGKKYRGRQAWPQFRSFAPGFVPWFVNGVEARFLTHCLEQTVDVAQRAQADPELLAADDDLDYLVRVPQEKGSQLVWRDVIRQVPPPPTTDIHFTITTALLERLKRLPRDRSRILADLFLVPAPIRERGERPYFGYMLLLVEESSLMILGTELLQPVPTLDDMRNKAADQLISMLAAGKSRPSRLTTSSPDLHARLEAIGDQLGVSLAFSPVLPQMEEIKAGLFSFLER